MNGMPPIPTRKPIPDNWQTLGPGQPMQAPAPANNMTQRYADQPDTMSILEAAIRSALGLWGPGKEPQ